MYSSRHNHALRRSREGSGRFVGGPVDNPGTTNEVSSIESPSMQTSYYQSESNNNIVTTSTSTNNYLPFSHQMESPQEPYRPSSEANTNNNNHTPSNEEQDVIKSSSGNESSVTSSEQRGTVITDIAVS